MFERDTKASLYELRRAWRSCASVSSPAADPSHYADFWFSGIEQDGATFYAVMGRHKNELGQAPDLKHPFIAYTQYLPLTETDLVGLVNVLRDENVQFAGKEEFKEQVKMAIIALWDALNAEAERKAKVAYGFGLTSGRCTRQAEVEKPLDAGVLLEQLELAA